jgi:hypothetical protein
VLLPISFYLHFLVERRKHERRALGNNVALTDRQTLKIKVTRQEKHGKIMEDEGNGL